MDGTGVWSLCLSIATPTGRLSGASAWSLAPATVLPLLVLAGLYAFGGRRVTREQRSAFAVGWLLLVVALVSPLCRLSASLAWAHMVQFTLLVGFAPALLAAGGLGSVVARLVSPCGNLGRPPLGLAVTIYGLALWGWHAPPFYARAISDPVFHVLAYAALIVVSVWFWSTMVAGLREHPLAVTACWLTTVVHTGFLGALLVFSPNLLYPVMTPGALAWGWDPLEDQQLAGLIMWVPGFLPYAAAALGVFWRLLQSSEGAESGLHGSSRRTPASTTW